MMELGWLLMLSALGVYFHSIFVSITLGFPIVIMALLLKYHRTGDEDYYKAIRLMTAVLAVNFALGAITGTLVEFGLVQAWPGTIIAIASFAFTPLAFELIAFANEIAFLVLFIVTLGRIKPIYSFYILAIYWIFAVFSGVLITAVNSWLLAPWGTGGVAKAIYPFIPEFGTTEVDVAKLLMIKIISLSTGLPLQAIIQTPEVAGKIGIILYEPYSAFLSPFGTISIFHNLFAAFIVGISIALLGYAIRYHKTKQERYLKILKIISPIFLVLFLIQSAIFGHFMGESVAKYNPTKFAMMENAIQSYQDPLVAFLAYGDPSKPIIGFDELKKACDLNADKKIGDLAVSVGIDKSQVISTAKTLGVALNEQKLESVLNLELRQICYADLERAMEKISVVHTSYYTKIFFGLVGFISAIALFANFKSKRVSNIVDRFLGNRGILVISILLFFSSVIPSVLGWFVREVGRKPWTVYGLLYPEELVTIVEYARTPLFAFFMTIAISSIVIFGLYAMYLVATREQKFVEL
ncbi:MAG: cytochrome ubiquinol oxidase subunit I, partial [Archaeoglobaceae archaeon]|nr:cytochrome ubiquinol oxidase subunit I [Archaeoglobaceae archaeon]